VDDFDFDVSDGEELVLDLTGDVPGAVGVELEGALADVDVPGGHVDYEVETIMNERGSDDKGDREYLVKWKYWPVPTWQPASSNKFGMKSRNGSVFERKRGGLKLT
jgi:hypothetical protein